MLIKNPRRHRAVGKEVHSTTAPTNSRQRPVNGKLWSTALPRTGPQLSAQVASLPTAQWQSRRHSGRQAKCDGARSFSDGAFLAECCPSAKTWLCRGSRQASAKVVTPWVLLLSAKLFCAEGPIKSARQRDKPSVKPEFPVGTNKTITHPSLIEKMGCRPPTRTYTQSMTQ
jgi:hypothetical protein